MIIGVDRIDAYRSSRGPLLSPEYRDSDGFRDSDRNGERTPATATRAELQANSAVATATGTRARIALAHDWLVGMRGGERVLDSIARLCTGRYEVVGLFTMFDNGRPHTPAIDALPKSVSSLNRCPRRARRWLLPLYPRAVSQLSDMLAREHARQRIDLLISTSSAAIKGLRPPAGVPHLCYCHTPARYLWSQTDQYTRGARGRLREIGFRLFGDRLREWDRQTAAGVTTFLANSAHTAAEIQRVYNRSAEVVHPPVRTDFFTPSESVPPGDSWLCVGALEPYKRIDLAIRAAAMDATPLTVVGHGSELAALRRLAGRSVTFDAHASDELLRHRYRQARVLIFPQTEDFGIVAVEAQACGTPVVAYRAGGALDTVIDGVTGAFFDSPTPDAIANAVRRCAAIAQPGPACRRNAERFSESAFADAMLAAIDRALSNPPRA